MSPLLVVIVMSALLAPSLAVKQKVNYGLVLYYGASCEVGKLLYNFTCTLKNLGNGTVVFTANVTGPGGFDKGKVNMAIIKSGDSSFTQTVPVISWSTDACKFFKDPRQFKSLLQTSRPPITGCPLPQGTYQFVDTLMQPKVLMDLAGPSIDDYYTYAGFIGKLIDPDKTLLACFEVRAYRMLLT